MLVARVKPISVYEWKERQINVTCSTVMYRLHWGGWVCAWDTQHCGMSDFNLRILHASLQTHFLSSLSYITITTPRVDVISPILPFQHLPLDPS